ncbi:serine hydrolase [Candidatus Shapirobacteria bacterium]|nr:serine hydrolase [Candidatus Shapirobacteria bacterium]
MTKALLSLFLGIMIYATGFFSATLSKNPNKINPFTESRLPAGYKYINPLLECDTDAVSSDTNLDQLRNSINKYIDSKIKSKELSHVSVYYRDMNNGPWFGINQNELFSPASLIKVPLMIAYFKLAESDPSILSKEVVASSSADQIAQNIVPQTTLIPDQKYTVLQLINSLIIQSDNQAYYLLLANIDNQFLVKVFADLGVDISLGFTNPNGDILSVKSYASFFRILYNASYLSPKYSETALHILNQSQYKDSLVAGVDPSISVAHKYGERSYLENNVKQFHDCGIVYLPGKPYLICIMTRGNDFKTLTTTIRDISQQIFTFVK